MPAGKDAVKKNFRIVVMGTAGVGKTSIINQYLHGQFTEKHKETVEELHHHVMKFENVTTEVDILDTSGSYQFPAMRKLAIATGDAFVLVYSTEKAESFETVKELREQIKDSKMKGKYSIVVVANKTDLNDYELSETTLHNDNAIAESIVCVDWEEKFVASSAKDDVNIQTIFSMLESKILERETLDEKRKTFFRRISLPVMKMTKPERSQRPFLKDKPRTSSVDV